MRVRPLTVDDEQQARLAHEELALDGFDFLLHERSDVGWADYLTRLENYRRGVDLPEGLVPATFLVSQVSGQLVGRVSIRHELNDYLAEIGGHIGFGVRPAFRRRGYATEMLRQALIVAHSAGVNRALVTCDDGNIGSATTIEKCGGVFERFAAGYDGSPAKRRYWIPLV